MANQIDEVRKAVSTLLELLERIATALEKPIGAAPETLQPPTPDPPAPSAPDTPGAAPSFSYDEVVGAINAYADRHGHQAAKTKLTEFRARYIKELKPEQYADVMKAFA